MASRLGILHLPRQVLQRPDGGHVMPGNDLLPDHHGMVITRCLREWACLLPLSLGFETAQRLLGWLTHDEAVISTSEVRGLVRQHATEIRAAEAQEVAELLAHPERRRQREYIGSGGVEKANDLIVARRMKRRGMHCIMLPEN